MVDLGKNCFEYETVHEGENKILKIYAEKCSFPPSIEYSDLCMAKVIDLLLKNSGITIINISQLREYEYDYSQTSLLTELAKLYRRLTQDERYNYAQLITDPQHERYISGMYAEFQKLLTKKLKEDPFATYVELKRLEQREKIKYQNLIDQRHACSQQQMLQVIQEDFDILFFHVVLIV